MILMLLSQPMKRLSIGSRVKFKLPSEAKVAPIEVQATALTMSRVVIERSLLSATF
jgi:hypothetical protein